MFNLSQVSGALLAILCIASPVGANGLADPQQPGEYPVGFVNEFNVELSTGHETNLAIWYPLGQDTSSCTGPDYSTFDADFGAAYSYLPVLPVYSPVGPGDCLPALGQHPMIVVDHGGGVANDFGRFELYELAEVLASHGFIAVGLNHRSGSLNRAADVSALIDHMGSNSALANHIDQDAIGLFGFSSSGSSATFAAVSDTRIKALLLFDPAGLPSFNPFPELEVPILVINGGFAAGVAQNILAQSSGAPLIQVHVKRATHLNFVTSLCDAIERNRQASIDLYRNASNPDYEPLLGALSGDANGAVAEFIWNIDKYVSASFPGGRLFCDTSDWATAVPEQLIPQRAQRFISDKDLLPILQLYSVAYLRAHLLGESAYDVYLSPEYAQQEFSPDTLKLERRN